MTQDPSDENCSLIDGFAVVIQFFMGLVALSSLLYKRRYLESPKRPWKIWFFDTSKQAMGQGSVHFANVLVSSLSIGGDPCVRYFLNLMMDTTVGVFTFYLLHLIVNEWLIYRFPVTISKLLRSGEYGNPPKLSRYFCQLFVFLLLQTLNKILIIILITGLGGGLYGIGEALLKSLHSWSVQAEALVVILVVPLIMNIFQFWVVDYFIMGKLAATTRAVAAGYEPISKKNDSKSNSSSFDASHGKSNEDLDDDLGDNDEDQSTFKYSNDDMIEREDEKNDNFSTRALRKSPLINK